MKNAFAARRQPTQARELMIKARAVLSLSGLVLLLAGPLHAAGESTLSPEERLQAIRLGLVQEALQGSTQVQAGAWIDDKGVLREASTFRSGMQVRGVRVLSYERDADGQPKATLQTPPQRQDLVKKPAALTQANAPSSAACASGEVPSRLRHLLGVQVELAGQWSADDSPALGELSRGLLAHWLQASEAASGWRMVEQGAAHVSASSYERLLTGASPELQMPWRAVVSISPVVEGPMPASIVQNALAWAGWQPARSTPVRLQFTVHAPGHAGTFLQASTQLKLHAEAQSWGPHRLTPASLAGINSLVQRWARDLGARLACETLRPEVLHVQGKELQINVGALAGVRPGDEWLLADRQGFPRRLLEPGVASQTVLARVQHVSALQARLQVVAGPAASVQARWQAWPAESPPVP